jgi:hypothetical protein
MTGGSRTIGKPLYRCARAGAKQADWRMGAGRHYSDLQWHTTCVASETHRVTRQGGSDLETMPV